MEQLQGYSAKTDVMGSEYDPALGITGSSDLNAPSSGAVRQSMSTTRM